MRKMTKIGQEGDTRKYRKLKKSDYYEAKAAAEATVVQYAHCRTCKRELGRIRKNWNGFCFECSNE